MSYTRTHAPTLTHTHTQIHTSVTQDACSCPGRPGHIWNVLILLSSVTFRTTLSFSLLQRVCRVAVGDGQVTWLHFFLF